MMDEAGSATGPRNPPQGHGLIVQTEMTQADGHAERKAALAMIHRHSPGATRRLTLGAELPTDAPSVQAPLATGTTAPILSPFAASLVPVARRRSYTSGLCHAPRRTKGVAQKVRHSAVDGRTIRHPGYDVSQKRRKKIEEPFGWAKTVGPMAQTMLRGVKRVGARFTLTMAACNLARLPRLLTI